MIVASPGLAPAVRETPVDLLDLFPTLPSAVGVNPAPEMDGRPGQSLFDISAAPPQRERVVFSEYHAAGSNTAGFMLRKGRWKLHHYVRHVPELFDLETDSEKLHDRAADQACAAVLQDLQAELARICDPEAVDARAKADQRALIERVGGPAVATTMGAGGRHQSRVPS